MKCLKPPDTHHLAAAQGWLGLGNHFEANAELERITVRARIHPDVLEAGCLIYAKARKWQACVDIAATLVRLAPERAEGWIQRSFALHALKRTQEAFEKLLPVAIRFPNVWVIPYNLACYCSQLGRFDEAQAWFKRAIVIDEKCVQRAGIDDPDLQPLWDSMSTTLWQRVE